MRFAGKHSSDGSFRERLARVQRQESLQQGRSSIRIDRSEPSSVAAQFAVEGAGNCAACASPVGRKSEEHRIALGQALGTRGRVAR